uniref:Uncharacterized protein n=1 Tax=Globodera rostochiensis TaxID=31243 RepID=A0A914I7P0_GLORO
MNAGQSVNLMDYVFGMLEQYANKLEEEVQERTRELEGENRKLGILLYRMMPRAGTPLPGWKALQAVLNKIHISKATHTLLSANFDGYIMESRGEVIIKIFARLLVEPWHVTMEPPRLLTSLRRRLRRKTGATLNQSPEQRAVLSRNGVRNDVPMLCGSGHWIASVDAKIPTKGVTCTGFWPCQFSMERSAPRSLVWDIKRRLLHSLLQQLDKACNYGLGSCLSVTEGPANFCSKIGTSATTRFKTV